MKMKQSGFGIASLILGIIGIFLGCVAIGIIPSILGVIFACIGMSQRNSKNGTAIGGLVCSIIGIVVFLFSLFIFTGDGTESSNNTENENTVIEDISSEKKEEKQEEEKTKLLDETVIYEENKCVIKAVECDNDSFKIHIKNDSDKDYSFNVHALAINGIMTGCNIYTGDTDVPSGKNGTMEVEFSSDWLYEIEDVKYIEMIIWAYDKAKSSKDFDTGIIRIETNKYTDDISFEQKDDWIDANGLHIVKGDMDDSYISYSIINGNDYFISATLDNCSINDWSFEPGYSAHISNNAIETSIDGWNIIVFPNCIANVVVDISDFMKENDMDKIDNFEFSLNILPNEDYFKEENTDKIVFKNE